ncbi:unnamed protein product (macronuclear) [Paramecium tetraurelia]|uniref:Chorein N-terminal domain-containing protein n=1 Tax=Paramecium tetraurelia TaxID=5888 RepID=A0BSN6_PARTE|nr:uncharacterized protein GSPATT00031785001 [Paramecium tetraurelia]CAK61553.1 unnamed protein product [Paramecium tetraurelia]|eukprot:XP_001428951.1 hypothetical protein (macronuclear) [Paramecium tetraurelia strain d4-2]
MQRFKEWLKPMKDYFLNSFSETSQLFLSNFLGDYLEDPQQLNIIALIKGIDNLQLKTKYINQLLGSSPFNFEDAQIKSLKISNLKFEAEKITFVIVLKDRSDDELKQYLQNLEEFRQRESAKINYLYKLRKEVYQRNCLEQCQNQNYSVESGFFNFLCLADTLLSNLSISIKNIQIIFKLEQGVQYEILTSGINLELHKAESNNILYITTIIDLIELRLKNDQIALMDKAIKLNIILETKDDNQVQLKLNGNVSSLDFLLNKKQIKTILKSYSRYQLKVDQISKALILLQNQSPGLVVAQNDKKNIKQFEMKGIEALSTELQKSSELNSFSNQQSQEVFQSLQLNVGETDYYVDPKIKNQQEQFKCYFQGIKLAVCEDAHQFPSLRERFFQELESHFFIEIADIVMEYSEKCLKLNIERMAAYRIKLNSPSFQFNLRETNNSAYNSERFFSCKSIGKQEFLVTPVVLIGQHLLQKVEYDYSIYNFANFQQQSDGKKAIDVNIQLLKCKDKNVFYSVKAEFSQIVASFRYDSIMNLLTYVPKQQIQQIPQKKTDVLYGLDIQIPHIMLSFFINEKTVSLKTKGITVKQKPTKAVELKTGFQESCEEAKYFQNPIQLISVSFNQIELEFEGQNIVIIDQDNVNKIKTYPTIYFAFQEIKQMKKERIDQLESVFNYKKQKCNLIISGLIPILKLKLSDNFLKWLISLKQYQQKFIKVKKQNAKKISQRFFYQLKINFASIGIEDNSLKLQTVSIVKAKQILILIQDIIAIDSQSLTPQNTDQKFKNFKSTQMFLYRMKNEVNSIQQDIKKDSFEISNNPLSIDYGKYVIQADFKEKTVIKMKNICFRLSDFQFKSFLKLRDLIDYYIEVDSQIQEDWFCKAQILTEDKDEEKQIQLNLEEDCFIDFLPLVSVETFSNQNEIENQLAYSNSRILLRVNNAKISSIVELNSIEIFIIGQNEMNNLFPLILNGFFDHKSHILQFGSQLKLKNVKYQDKLISIDQIVGNFKYDTIQNIIDIFNDLLKLIPQADRQVSEEQYKISQDFSQQLINEKIVENVYQFEVGQITIELEQGVTYYEVDVIYDDTEWDDEFDQTQDSNKICFNFSRCLFKVEMYKEGQIGIGYRSNFEIQDRIDKLYHKLILHPDFEEFELQDNSAFKFGLIIENQAYTGFISIVPMKIYISGALLQFIINFMSNRIKNEEKIDLDEIEIIKNVPPIIWLKNLQICETRLNITYDSSGLKVDGLLKGLLKISSFCNLQITLKDTQIESKGDIQHVQQQIIESIQESFGSKYQIAGKALQSLDAFVQVKNLGQEILNLFTSPFEKLGGSSGSIDLSKSLSEVFSNLKNGQERIQSFKFLSLSGSLLKRY